MRWPVIGGVVVGAVIVGGVAARGLLEIRGIPLSGCRVTSVDESTYVAGNRAILDALPVYPGSSRTSTTSHGWFASDACFSFHENSGPIERYQTRDIYTLPSDGQVIVPAPWKAPDNRGDWVRAQAPSVLLYYDGELRRRGWRRQGRSWTAEEVTYRKGTARLIVSAQLNIGDPYKRAPHYALDVIHDAE